VKLSIIIVTWNSGSTLSKCVDSILAKVREPRIEVILVDNRSSDPGFLDPYRNHPACIVIENPENLGFAAANNIGFARASGDHILILNPDMVFLDNPIPGLLDALARNPGLGAVAPLLVDESGEPHPQGYYFKFPNLLQTFLVRTLLDRVGPAQSLANRFCHSPLPTQALAKVDQLPGAFLLFRRETVPGPQVLCEAYFIWMEDVDFCKRLADRGLEVAVLADAKVVHIGGVSFQLWSHQRKRRIFTESYLTYIGIHHRGPVYFLQALILTANSAAVLILFALRNILLRRWSRLRQEAAAEAAILALLARGCLGRPASAHVA
jgi:GT2 family glycosyltransferase